MISVDLFAAAAPEPTTSEALDPGAARLAVVVGADAGARWSACRAIARTWASRFPDVSVVAAPPAAAWPFRHPLASRLPGSPAILWVDDIHEAAVSAQAGSTRLVTTQVSYLFGEWLAAVGDRDDVLLLASADRHGLECHAPELLRKMGPFREAYVHEVPPPAEDERRSGASAGRLAPSAESPAPTPQEMRLIEAFRAPDPAERLEECIAALEMERSASALVAAASTCMEVNDLDAAARDLDEALAKAPDWAAAHFERGKLWLRVDDMERAAASFRAAAERLPGFGAAWANLGATLGELDRTAEALTAFERALALDPDSHQALNNIGIVSRELGRLAESEAALRRVIALVPDLAFGHYNLGHTLFLQGRYHAALSAYAEGQRRDPERNAVQATRLALCRLATGDADRALADLRQATAGLPGEYRRQLLSETSTILWALLTHKPELAGWKQVNDWVAGQLKR